MTDVAEVCGVERTFDRVESEDPRRLLHRMERAVETDRPLRSRSWAYVQLDQGQQGACTGFSATMEAAARPVPIFGDPASSFSQAELDSMARTAQSVYVRAKELDVFPGTDHEGSSVDGACLAGRELGWWDAWVWSTGSGEAQAMQVMQALAWRGPVMVGTGWREGMESSEDGFMSYSGADLGGHAYLYTRVRVPVKTPRTAEQRAFAERAPRGAVWTPNSWGGKGQGWMTFEDLAASLADHGEAALVVNRLQPS